MQYEEPPPFETVLLQTESGYMIRLYLDEHNRVRWDYEDDSEG